MSFYETSTGDPIEGTPELANITPFTTIPDGTLAKAKINSVEFVETKFDGEDVRFYQVTWELTETDFSGAVVKQKLKVFDDRPNVADRAKQMLVRLMKLTNTKPNHNGPPKEDELANMTGKILGIKVNQWFFNDKEGNWVSAVFDSENFESKVGILKEAPENQKINTSTQLNSLESYDKLADQQKQSNFSDDIPF